LSNQPGKNGSNSNLEIANCPVDKAIIEAIQYAGKVPGVQWIGK
jgi:hypothetical protein